MPSIAENKATWDKSYAWGRAGDEWSDEWGSARAQWFKSLLPRIFPLLPCHRMLEIAPGYGRWTQFLKEHCETLIAVDLSESCILKCRERFADSPNIEFAVNDGLALPMVEDSSIDFVFSFDSLVHAEADVLESYVREAARVLRPGGAGFIHHSNLKDALKRGPLDRIRRRFSGKALQTHWRSSSMSAELMRRFCENSAISCVQQEIIPWGHGWPAPIDCLTTFVKRSGIKPVIMHNRRFMDEARAAKRIAGFAARGAGAGVVNG